MKTLARQTWAEQNFATFCWLNFRSDVPEWCKNNSCMLCPRAVKPCMTSLWLVVSILNSQNFPPVAFSITLIKAHSERNVLSSHIHSIIRNIPTIIPCDHNKLLVLNLHCSISIDIVAPLLILSLEVTLFPCCRKTFPLPRLEALKKAFREDVPVPLQL